MLLVFFLVPAYFCRNRRLRERFALNLPEPLPKKGNLWVHALSVGEVLSAVPLLEALKVAFPEKDIVLSVSTRSGMMLAEEKLSGRVACMMTLPVDAWWCMRRVVNHVNPSAFYSGGNGPVAGPFGFIGTKRCQEFSGECGRISPRTLKSYQKVPAVIRRMFAPLEYCLMQTDLDRDRLLHLGLDPKKVITAGNIKFDRDRMPLDSTEKDRWFETLGLNRKMRIWVAGSTHAGEEGSIAESASGFKTGFSPVAPDHRTAGCGPVSRDFKHGRQAGHGGGFEEPRFQKRARLMTFWSWIRWVSLGESMAWEMWRLWAEALFPLVAIIYWNLPIMVFRCFSATIPIILNSCRNRC